MVTTKIPFVCYGLLLSTFLGKNAEGQTDSMQCQRKGEACWCVDHLTGVEIEGSRVLLKQGLPLCGRFETELYYLNSTNVLCSSADEAKVNKCLGSLYGTFLDLPYAGSNFNHLLFANYVFLSGKLELACRLFEEYNQCSSTAFNGTSCRHCQHIVFMKLFDYLCRPKHLVTIKPQLACLQGLFMDEMFIQCQLRLLDELKAAQQQGSDPQKLCAIKLQLQVCLLKRLPQYCDQDMTKLLAALPERVIEGLNVSCEGLFPLATKAPEATAPGVVPGAAGVPTGVVTGRVEIPGHITYATISPLPTKIEEGLRLPGAGLMATKIVSETPGAFRFTPYVTEPFPSAAGEVKVPSVMPTVYPRPKTEEIITTSGFYPTPSGAITTAEGAFAGYPTAPMKTFGPEVTETMPTGLPAVGTAYPGVERMKVIAPGIKEVAAVVAEHVTRLPYNATGRWTSPEWLRTPERPGERGPLPSESPGEFPPTSVEPPGRTPSYGESEAPIAVGPYALGTTSEGPRERTGPYALGTTSEGLRERTFPPVSTYPSVATEFRLRPEVTEALKITPTVPPSARVTKPGELPEAAFAEDRTISTMSITEPTERRYELVGEGVEAPAVQAGVTVHRVAPPVDSRIYLRPSAVGRNESELIAPADIDCSAYNMRFKFCFRTHFFPMSLGQLTLEALLNNTWHWPKLTEVCRLFHDYLSCMYQPSLNPMGLCDPFGHTALSGMLNAVCEHDVATTLYLNSHCLSSTLRNTTWASQCLATLVDFVRIVHYLPISDAQICQRIRDMHSCVSTLDLSGCGEDLQFALAKLKLTGLQAESYLCGKYLLGPSLRQQVEWWNRRRANDLPFEELGCVEERRRVLSSNAAKDRYVPRCTSKGYYNLVQCDYSVGQCWCVDVESGVEQSKSRKALPESVTCGGCFIHKARLLNDTESKQSIPTCLDNGLYAPLQCNFGTSECWCADERSGTEIMYTRVHKGRRLPRCGMKSEFSCSWIPPKKRCAPDGSTPKFVLRWFRDGWKCTLRPISFCPHESHLPPFTFRFQFDCEEMCLGPYSARLPVRYIE